MKIIFNFTKSFENHSNCLIIQSLLDEFRRKRLKIEKSEKIKIKGLDKKSLSISFFFSEDAIYSLASLPNWIIKPKDENSLSMEQFWINNDHFIAQFGEYASEIKKNLAIETNFLSSDDFYQQYAHFIQDLQTRELVF